MTTHHSLHMLFADTEADESCKERLIEHMLSIFPDAVVDGPPAIYDGSNSKSARVVFTSPMFDHVAGNMLVVINEEFSGMKEHLNASPILTQDDKVAYSYILDALTDRINYIFGGKE